MIEREDLGVASRDTQVTLKVGDAVNGDKALHELGIGVVTFVHCECAQARRRWVKYDACGVPDEPRAPHSPSCTRSFCKTAH